MIINVSVSAEYIYIYTYIVLLIFVVDLGSYPALSVCECTKFHMDLSIAGLMRE